MDRRVQEALMEHETDFVAGRQQWLERLGNLRNVVRQDVIARQLAGHVQDLARASRSAGQPRRLTILDVGAGQGTQAIRLARLGHEVTAVDPDPAMRACAADLIAAEDPETTARMQLRPGGLGGLATVLPGTAYDVVLCHGVFMYLPESAPAVAELAPFVAPGGLLSLVVRNAAGLALRPALQGRWSVVQDLLDEVAAARREGRDPSYTNEIGVRARADDVATLSEVCRVAGLGPVAHYGVRLVSDLVPVDAPAPTADELEALVNAELRLGELDPYRQVATLAHLLYRRPIG